MSQPVASTKSKEVSPRGKSGRDFTSVFHEYQRPIFNYLLRMTQKTDLAEDLTQETFVRVYRGLSNFRGGAKLSTWIYRIATNVSFDHFRSKGSRQESVTVSFGDNVADQTGIPDKDSPPPEQAVAQSEMSACVQQFIRDLPLDYRAVIILSDRDSAPAEDAQEILFKERSRWIQGLCLYKKECECTGCCLPSSRAHFTVCPYLSNRCLPSGQPARSPSISRGSAGQTTCIEAQGEGAAEKEASSPGSQKLWMKLMKAIVYEIYGPPDVLQLKTVSVRY